MDKCDDCGSELAPYAGHTQKECERIRVRAAEAHGEVLPFFVYAIAIDRCFGGREEGGWYYDRTTILRVVKAWGWRGALRAARELRETFGDDAIQKARTRFSVLGGADHEIGVVRTLERLPEEGPWGVRYE